MKSLIALLALLAASTSWAYVYPYTTIPPETRTLYPQNYGIKCDGVTDNTVGFTAMNTAIAAFAGNPYSIYFSPQPAKCLTGQSLAPKANGTIYAQPGTVTIAPTATSASTVLDLSIANTSNIVIYGLTFDGGGQDYQNANNVTQVFNSSNILFDHVTWQHTRGIALVPSTTLVNVGVVNSTFNDIGNHWKTTTAAADRKQAVAFCCGTTSANVGNFVRNSYFNDIGLDAISAGSQTDFSATGNVCELSNNQLSIVSAAAYAACVYFTGNVGGVIANNIINTPSGNGIDTTSSINFSVTGNYVYKAGSTGIGIFGGDAAVTVSGNTTVDNSQWASALYNGGITVSATTNNVTITGNTAYDDQGASQTQLYGLHFSNANSVPVVANGLRVYGNNFNSNKTAQTFGAYSGISSVPPTEGIASSDNILYNGQFLIDQINNYASVTGAANHLYTADGWLQNTGNLGSKVSYQSSASNPPPGLARSELITVTAQTSPASTDFLGYCHFIEGMRIADLGWGTAGASPVVLSFWFKSSVTGTFSIQLNSPNSTNYNISTFTNPVASTWEYVTISFLGPTVGTWTIARAKDMTLCFDLGSGSSQQTASTATWITSVKNEATGAAQLVANANGSTMNIANVRLAKGNIDTPYTPRPYDQELAIARRYYQTSIPDGTAVAQNAGLAGAICTKNPIASGDPSMFVPFSPEMVATPTTLTTYNPSVANANWRDVTAAADATVSVDPGSAKGATGFLVATSGTVTTLGDILCIHYSADARF